jgi:energy-coupling factor transporter ATP-binding protein EcfA2
MDFCRILSREVKGGMTELYPDFNVGDSEDLMVRGGAFYAVWDEELQLWSTSMYDVKRMVDDELFREAQKHKELTGAFPLVKYMEGYSTGSWKKFNQYLRDSDSNFKPLNAKLMFANDVPKKKDYASKRLPYALEEGPIPSWDELVGLLYSPDEREKIEWAIGSIVSGDSRTIQKFFVLYGPTGTGKSTVLKIIEKLFQGYTTTFDGAALGRSNDRFAAEAFRNFPLVAIQHDADLSKLEKNTTFNSLVSHEEMPVEGKFEKIHTSRFETMLFLGTNQPVRISDAQSGILRRLIDVNPSGAMHTEKRYDALMSRIEFELGAIAWHCQQVYQLRGKHYYNSYRPTEMMFQTNPFFNFVEAYYDVFSSQENMTAKQAYIMYTEFCEEQGLKAMPQHRMRDELRNYFDEFHQQKMVDGERMRSVYVGFNADKFKGVKMETGTFSLVLEETESLFDEVMANQPAQLASPSGTMYKKWDKVRTTLSSIDTGELHWVKVPGNHIVIDFDLESSNGTTALERNLEAASNWPSTYAELSKSGEGVHLHYTYRGDPAELAAAYSDGIEVKTLQGDGALRRKLTRCNAVPISSISTGLPLKKKEKMLESKTIQSEQGLRDLIARNLRKEIHPGTKPSVDFIKKILDDAYESGMKYDVSDLKSKIIAFANNSTNQAANALKTVREMKWSSENPGEEFPGDVSVEVTDERLAFFDVEVYPNLFVVCWKYQGDANVVRMINPKAHEVAALFKLKLVGFYNRRFDNHILYAASMGASNAELFKLTQKLIEGNRSATFGAAYGLSYADIWDFSTERMSLKKFEIKLGILHLELDLPWDQDVPEDKWDQVVEYCVNDVVATEAVFHDRKADFVARQILADLSGLTVNDTTQVHTAKIVFGNDKNPQKKFVYTDLSEMFPGYKFELGKSSYKGEDPGEGGYVYAEPGIYQDVEVLDVASMHPASMVLLNIFGPYTERYKELMAARLAIKRQDYDKARTMLDGKLAPHLEGAENDEVQRHGTELAYALRIALNIVYGLTSAKFDNPFRDIRNIDNIVAKRGALFMIDLKEELQKAGYTVAHIKTDSVKIPNADAQVAGLVKTIGSMYGYEFDHEATYERFCLVNDAVYIGRKDGTWEAVGAQFAHPYVFKSLFSREPVDFDDLCEARSVTKGTMYLDIRGSDLDQQDYRKMRHVGRTGLFVPVKQGGGVLYRVYDEKYYAVSGTKGYMWMEAQVAREIIQQDEIDMSYFDKLKDDAIKTIEQFGSFEEFTK